MNSKRILSLVLAMVMVLGTFGTVFADTADTTSEKIDWLVKQGIVQGTGSGLELDGVVDRATLARIVAVALGEEAAADSLKLSPSGFKDMTVAHWANGYAALANGRGYMVGNEKQEFMPGKSTTYAEALSVLVRVSLGRDLTDAEKAGSITWYAPYVAKAAELGITDGVSVANVAADAVRQDILEMLYNVLQNTENARYDVLKAIVLENERVAKLAKDEIKVEILEEVQRANFVDASRKVKGEQRTLKLTEDLEASAEDLLGRVADFTFDKNGKLVDVKVDESYKVEEGSLKATDTRLGSFRVEVKERYESNKEDKDADRTLFRTYHNNKDYAYEDYFTTPGKRGSDRTDDFTADYVRATVKDGRVLFINAFSFEDISPVKDVEKDGERVLVYNDSRDGAVKRYELTDKSVIILVKDGVLSTGTYEDVKVDNVVHEYDGGFIVKQDKAVVGKFEKVSEDKDGDVFVHVDGEKYEVGTKQYKKPVYEFEVNKDFYTLEAKEAYAELKNFRDEDVRVLTDLGGKLQYIGSEVDLGEFVGLATRIVGKEMRVLRADNKAYDYEANLDTKVNNKTTGHRGLNDIEANSLVYVRANDKTLEKVHSFGNKSDGKAVEKFDDKLKEITVATDDKYRILDETVVFVVNKDIVEARSLKDVQYAYDKMEDKDAVRALVLSDETYQAETVRDLTGRSTEAYAIVFYGLEMTSETKTVYGKYLGYDDRQETKMNIKLADGSEETVKLAKNVKVYDVEDKDAKLSNISRNDVLKLQETKTDDKVITEIKIVIDENSPVYQVEKTDRNGNIELTNGDKVYETRNTQSFDGNLVKGDKVSLYFDENDEYISASVKRSRNAVVDGETSAKAGVVTYIDGLKVTTAADEVVTVTLPVENTDAYRVRVINVTAGTAGAPSADFYGTRAFKASELEVDTAGTPTTLDATINTDNKYNVIVEVKQADGTYKIVDNKIVETVDPAKTSLLSAKVKTAYVAPVDNNDVFEEITVYAKVAGKSKLEIVTTGASNAPLSFADNAGSDGYVITLGNDADGNVSSTWAQVVNFINNNATLKAAYKAELTGTDQVAKAVTETGINSGATGETQMVVTLTFDKALKNNATAKYTIDGTEMTTTVNITGTPTTVDVTLDAGVTTATKVTALDGFESANGTPATVPAGGVTITQ